MVWVPTIFGLDETSRSVDRAIHMALSSQMHHCVGVIAVKDIRHFRRVADINSLEREPPIAGHGCERLQVAGIVVDNHRLMIGLPNQMSYDGGADEACTPGNEKSPRH
jgi:hypothetical protein